MIIELDKEKKVFLLQALQSGKINGDELLRWCGRDPGQPELMTVEEIKAYIRQLEETY